MIADTERGRFAAVTERDDAVNLMMSNGKRASELTEEVAQVKGLGKLVEKEAFRKREEKIKRALAAYDIKEVWMDWHPEIVRMGWLDGLQAWLDWQDWVRAQAQPQGVKRSLGESRARVEEDESSQVSKKRKLLDSFAAPPAAAAAAVPKKYLRVFRSAEVPSLSLDNAAQAKSTRIEYGRAMALAKLFAIFINRKKNYPTFDRGHRIVWDPATPGIPAKSFGGAECTDVILYFKKFLEEAVKESQDAGDEEAR